MIDKKAEINNKYKLYLACRGILRIKQAAAAGAEEAYDPNAERMYDSTDFGSDLGGNLYEYFSGGTADGLGGQAAQAAGGIVLGSLGDSVGNSVISGLKNQGGWMGAIGNALDSETGRSAMSAAAHYGMDTWNKAIKSKNYEAAKAKAKKNMSFDPNTMFANMFQNAANSYNTAGQNAYFGNTTPTAAYY